MRQYYAMQYIGKVSPYSSFVSANKIASYCLDLRIRSAQLLTFFSFGATPDFLKEPNHDFIMQRPRLAAFTPPQQPLSYLHRAPKSRHPSWAHRCTNLTLHQGSLSTRSGQAGLRVFQPHTYHKKTFAAFHPIQMSKASLEIVALNQSRMIPAPSKISLFVGSVSSFRCTITWK